MDSNECHEQDGTCPEHPELSSEFAGKNVVQAGQRRTVFSESSLSSQFSVGLIVTCTQAQMLSCQVALELVGAQGQNLTGKLRETLRQRSMSRTKQIRKEKKKL